jgi:pyrimidine-nucleoside phosphorylase
MTAIDIGAGRRTKDDKIDHSAGFVFDKKVGHKVKKGDTILTIHTNKPESIDAAKTRLTGAITIAPKKEKERKIILYRVDKDGMTEWSIQ